MNTMKIAVIGGGIAGVTTAYGLARRGAAVTLLDDAAAGQATAASAGIIAPWVSSSDGDFYEAYSAGGNYYPEFLAGLHELGIAELGYRRSGALMVSREAAELEAVEDRIARRVAASGSVAGKLERVDSTQVSELFPALSSELTGLYVSGGGRVDGRVLRNATLTAAVILGTEHHEDSVLAVEPLRGAGWRVTTTRQSTDVDAVVVAAGARTRELLLPLDVDCAVNPQRGQITHLRLRGVNTSPWPTVHPFTPNYITPFDDGRIAVGATRESGSGYDPRITAAGQLQVLQDALSLAPGLADASLVETRVGIRPMGDDNLPIVGEVPGRPGLWTMTGYGAGGLTLGPLLGDAAARSILGDPASELAPFPTATPR
ncbi:NAD(P)/FAD-dependent oxidoreductase [Brevibacterium renqingii]|uniref:NAD(P)/FAD-dependent oxidoreductase n=1 Tax=Brevibacterium renqingii TaxID=2776916 RepID=UPI001AE00DC9|nr:FAD-dependent oxidoreductase [Brevibacterium renqingii]